MTSWQHHEDRVDAWIRSCTRQAIGDLPRGLARWTLLSMFADYPKTLANLHQMGRLPDTGVALATKWMMEFHGPLKYGFKLIDEAITPAGTSLPQRLRISDEAGRRFWAFRADLERYDQVCRLFAAARSGVFDVEVHDDTVALVPRHDFARNHVFELTRPVPRMFAPLRLATLIFADPRRYLEAAEHMVSTEAIVLSTTRRGDHDTVDYRIDERILGDMVATFDQRSATIPDGWRCGPLSGPTLRRGLAVLQAAAYYNAVAAWGGGLLHQVTGGGVEQAVLVVGRADLRSWLERFAGLDASTLDAFFRAFTMRDGGDPTLQPIVAISDTLVALDPLVLLASDLERNCLKVLATEMKRDFDASSSAFESQMISRIEQLFRRAGWRVLTNERFGGEEIDVVAGRHDSSSVLVLEAKWEIRASDPMEMKRSREGAAKKRAQVLRKATRLLQHLADAERRLGVQSMPEPRTVLPVVVVEGGIGLPAAEGAPEVLPIEALALLLFDGPSAGELTDRLGRQAWLPQEGAHFTRHDAELDVGGVRVRYPGFVVHPDDVHALSPPGVLPWLETEVTLPPRVTTVKAPGGGR